MPTFECQRCGACCRNLIINLKDKYSIGLWLLPQETKIFPATAVSPMWAINTHGRSRPGRPKPVIYQLNLDTCLFLSKDNKCLIYDHRPLICRAFPLTIHIDGTATLDKRCPGCHKANLYGITGKPTEIFNTEILNANILIHRAHAKAFTGDYNKVFLYDVRKRAWLTLIFEDVKAINA